MRELARRLGCRECVLVGRLVGLRLENERNILVILRLTDYTY